MLGLMMDIRGDAATRVTRSREFLVGVMAFLTVVDLFATQAILPALAQRYGVSAAAMSTAVNATTFGMAVSGLATALFAHRIERRAGIIVALGLLSIPTAILSLAPDLPTFAMLRVIQGVLMAAAFTLSLAHLAESTMGQATAAVFAAYITGNVASNLFGRLISASVADTLGVPSNFVTFALLNLAGAVIAAWTLEAAPSRRLGSTMGAPSLVQAHLRNPALRAAFAIGFCILFAFIGIFTYVNFVLVKAPFSLDMMSVGLVYLVFLPSIVTTPLASRVVARIGTMGALWSGLWIAIVGLPLVLLPHLASVLTGLALIGVGTFLAQAVTTGFVGRAAAPNSAAASGIYLAAYFSGGLIGTAVLGYVFETIGWTACVLTIGCVLGYAMLLGRRINLP
jgi:predicted MFS family arabinose efflux permease